MKKIFSRKKRLYLITDRTISGLSHSAVVKQAVRSGIRVIQLREKNLSKRLIYEEAASIRSFTRERGVTFIVNDYVDIACAVEADGVHLGQEDMPVHEARKILGRKSIIGVSTHSLRQALKAQQDGADYIGFGPLFRTSTKDAGRPKGVSALRAVREQIRIPLVAIGGITPENAPPVLEAGADALAVASALLRGDMEKEVKKFLPVL